MVNKLVENTQVVLSTHPEKEIAVPNFDRANEAFTFQAYHALRNMGVEHEDAMPLAKIPELRSYDDKLGRIVEALEAGALIYEIADACQRFTHHPECMDTYLDRRCRPVTHKEALRYPKPRRVQLTP